MNVIELLLPVVGAVAAAFVLHRFVIRKRVRQSPDKPEPSILTLRADARAFTVTDSRKIKSLDVRWVDVKQLTLIRTDAGPFSDTVFYHVAYEGGDITLPAGANNMQAFIEHVTGLPGFDRAAHDAAAASTANNTFTRLFGA